MIHMALIPWLNNSNTLGKILLAIDFNTDTSNQLIDVSTRTQSHGYNAVANQHHYTGRDLNTQGKISTCFNENLNHF